MLPAWEKNGDAMKLGLVTKGLVVDPAATDTKGIYFWLAAKLAGTNGKVGLIVTRAVPSARVTTGT